MYIRFSALLPITALAAVAAAAPNGLETGYGGLSQCNTGSLQCCNNLYDRSDWSLTSLLGELGAVLPDVEGLVGLDCTPITVVGTGSGASCTQQPICCSGNTYNGLINIGCSPISL